MRLSIFLVGSSAPLGLEWKRKEDVRNEGLGSLRQRLCSEGYGEMSLELATRVRVPEPPGGIARPAGQDN